MQSTGSIKRFFFLLVLAASLSGCSANREHVLKVYNWADYIDRSIIPLFESWYREQTGERIKVYYKTYDGNETLLEKIEENQYDCDVACPSDYAIERMLASDLLLPLNLDFGSTPDYITGNISPYIRSCFDLIDGGGKNANEYAVGYMWGTTGLLYNAKYVSEKEARSWNILRNREYANKIYIKDSARDVYSQIILVVRKNAIEKGRFTKDQLMRFSGDKSIELVETFMKDVSEIVAGWEADFGKEQMVREHGWINLTWSGDALWAIHEAAPKGVDLRFSIPDEGATVWYDGWVIPKYARNTKAARYWINFLNRPDIVLRNVKAIGYVSASCAPEVREALSNSAYSPLDLSYFFGPDADSVHVNPILYPDRSVIERLAMEHDWGIENKKLENMWSRVKVHGKHLR